eukprot:6426238-Amphidinium_carterae.1
MKKELALSMVQCSSPPGGPNAGGWPMLKAPLSFDSARTQDLGEAPKVKERLPTRAEHTI